MSLAVAACEPASAAAGLSPALVHDYLLVLRGAERTFAAIADCWADAPIYTLLYDREATADRFGDRDVRTSPLQRLKLEPEELPPAAAALPGRHRRLAASAITSS